MSREGQGRKESWRKKLFPTFWEIQNPKSKTWSPGRDINSDSAKGIQSPLLLPLPAHSPDPWGSWITLLLSCFPLPIRTFQAMLDPCLFAHSTEDKTEAGPKKCTQNLFLEAPSPPLPAASSELPPSRCVLVPVPHPHRDAGGHRIPPRPARLLPTSLSACAGSTPRLLRRIHAGSRGCCRV